MKVLAAVLGAILLVVALTIVGCDRAEHTKTIDSATRSRVGADLKIAQGTWGPVCDGNVTVVRGTLPAGVFAHASYRFAEGTGETAAGYFDCTITLTGGHINDPVLCTAIVHEVGHLAGWRAPPGGEFVRPDGTKDRFHSNNPRKVMYPNVTRTIYPRCVPKHSESLGAPVTVLLLPGGGWQNADVATMAPWVADFARHNIHAVAVTYRLRDVPGAIADVRQVADRQQGPVVAYGISAGGTLAAALAATGAVDGAVNIAGPTDFERWVTPAGLVIKAQIGMTTRAQQHAASPYYLLNGHQSPQLEQCGAIDPLVPCDQAWRYTQAAKRAQPDTKLDVMVNAHAQSTGDRTIAREWIAARWPTP